MKHTTAITAMLCRIITVMMPAMAILCSCSKHEDITEKTISPTIAVYIYSPEKPLAARADIGYTTATMEESRVNTLQIWIFTAAGNELVGYLSTNETSQLNNYQGDAYMLSVSDKFARSPENVSVYVAANAEATGLTLGKETTAAQLEAALIEKSDEADLFGPTERRQTTGQAGLPMTGVLRNQTVTGQSPVFRIGNEDAPASLKLVRMVSKLRFVVTQSETSTDEIAIQNIVLEGETMPTGEYLFLETLYDERTARVTDTYIENECQMLSAPLTTLARTEDPATYSYEGEDAQTYETKINSGIGRGELNLLGTFYLRETDKTMKGHIDYTINGQPRQAVFSTTAEGDFSRNHTWIVYAYYGAATLNVSTIEIKDWIKADNKQEELYNW